jgi:hypothetical protein
MYCFEHFIIFFISQRLFLIKYIHHQKMFANKTRVNKIIIRHIHFFYNYLKKLKCNNLYFDSFSNKMLEHFF